MDDRYQMPDTSNTKRHQHLSFAFTGIWDPASGIEIL